MYKSAYLDELPKHRGVVLNSSSTPYTRTLFRVRQSPAVAPYVDLDGANLNSADAEESAI